MMLVHVALAAVAANARDGLRLSGHEAVGSTCSTEIDSVSQLRNSVKVPQSIYGTTLF